MSLRSPLALQPYDFIGDSAGRPLDNGLVYIGQQGKDPEFYPITVYLDREMTKPILQPILTKGGFLSANGDFVELYAAENVYSVKVLDRFSRKVIFKGDMMRGNLADDILPAIESAITDMKVENRSVLAESVAANEAYTVNTVQDAINNTAIPGGILADTFVTATANIVGSIPRNQRDVNADFLSIKNFGSFADGGDWTSALQLAVATGKAIRLPDGVYGVRADLFNNAGKNFILYAENAEIVLLPGTGNTAFDVSNAPNVIIRGIKFSSKDNISRRMLTVSPTSLIDNYSVTGSRFNGNVSIIRALGSKTQMPSVTPFGFKRYVYSGNESFDVNTTHIELVNYPIYSGEMSNNTLNNFSYAHASMGIYNDAANKDELNETTQMVADRNIVTNDDSHWAVATSGSYYCYLLIEGNSCKWTNNQISGMKVDKAGLSLFDAYLNCANITSKGNIYKNNANFNANNNNRLMMSKEFSRADKTATKVFDDNTYIIEDDWLARIGKTKCEHQLFNLGAGSTGNTGNLTVTKNTFDLHTLKDSGSHLVEALVWAGNDISAKFMGDTAHMVRFSPVANSAATAFVANNNLSIANNAGFATSIFDAGTIPATWNKFVAINNALNVDKGTANNCYLFSGVKAKVAVVENNTVNGNQFYDFFSCSFGELNGSNNNFVGSRPIGSWVMRGLKFIGDSKIKTSHTGLISLLYFPVHLETDIVPSVELTKYRIKVRVESATEVTDIEFTYTLKYVAGAYTALFIDSLDAPKEILLGGTDTEGNLTVVKSAKSLGSKESVYIRFYNYSTGQADFAVMGLPTSKVKVEVSASSFSL